MIRKRMLENGGQLKGGIIGEQELDEVDEAKRESDEAKVEETQRARA